MPTPHNILDSEIANRFTEFCMSIGKNEKVMVIHHTDADGISSGVITVKALEQIVGKKPESILPYDYGTDNMDRAFLTKVKEEKADRIIMVDVGIDSNQEFVRELERLCDRLMIIDHHKLVHDFNSETTVLVKAEKISSVPASAYANAKLCFDLFSKLTNITSLDWLACVGITGDMAIKQWGVFCPTVLKKHGLHQADIDKIVWMVGAVEILAFDTLEELQKEFYKTKSPKELLKSTFFSYLDQYQSLVAEWEEKYETKVISNPAIELNWFTIKTPYRIKSALANQVSQKNPEKTIIIFQEFEAGSLGFSARRQDGKIKMNDLLETAIEGIPSARAGGHAPAAAGGIPVEYREQFLKKLTHELEKQYK
jgi:single-stranded DNA-specific DHH superfamily exonuclease